MSRLYLAGIKLGFTPVLNSLTTLPHEPIADTDLKAPSMKIAFLLSPCLPLSPGLSRRMDLSVVWVNLDCVKTLEPKLHLKNCPNVIQEV